MRIIRIALMLLMVTSCAGIAANTNDTTTFDDALCAQYGKCQNSKHTGEDLKDVVMFATNYSESELSGISLKSKNLFSVDFRNSDLRNANFENANLAFANFGGADITGANFSGALLTGAHFGDVESANVNFSNTLGTDTVYSDYLIKNSNWKGAVLIETKPSARRPSGALVCYIECAADVLPDYSTTANIEAADFVDYSRGLDVYTRQHRLSPAVVSRLYGYSGKTVITALDSGYSQSSALTASVNVIVELLDPALNHETLTVSRDYIAWHSTKDTPGERQEMYYTANEVTKNILLLAKQDGYNERNKEYSANNKEEWSPTAPAFNPGTEPGWGSLKLFNQNSAQCVAPKPAYNANKEAESVYSITENLTEDHKDAARFWDDGRGRTSTPVGHWRTAAVNLLVANTVANDASTDSMLRKMANIDMAVADTVIRVWSDKYLYRTPRVSTVINGNHPEWRPYIINPPFPAYPSGHAAISMTASELLYSYGVTTDYTDPGWGSDSLERDSLMITSRKFENVKEAAKEAGMSRIWGGIHIMPDYYASRTIGECIAQVYSSIDSAK